MNNPPIEILLATYNGEKFLETQIDSILNQTYTDFRVLVSDGGSTDRTLEIVSSYQEKFPNNISLLSSHGEQLSAVENFSRLIEESSAKYLMFCDQDDVWLPSKIQESLIEIKKIEGRQEAPIPALVHSDLVVVDRSLDQLSPSFLKAARLNPGRVSLNQLFVQNVITGNTIIFNRALADLAVPIPSGAQMHDWWLALVAASFGKIGLVNRPLVLYRQHGQNVLGATVFNFNYLTGKFKEILTRGPDSILEKNFLQAEALQVKLGELLPQPQQRTLNAFLALSTDSFFRKRWRLLKNGFTKGTLAQTIGLLLRI